MDANENSTSHQVSSCASFLPLLRSNRNNFYEREYNDEWISCEKLFKILKNELTIVNSTQILAGVCSSSWKIHTLSLRVSGSLEKIQNFSWLFFSDKLLMFERGEKVSIETLSSAAWICEKAQSMTKRDVNTARGSRRWYEEGNFMFFTFDVDTRALFRGAAKNANVCNLGERDNKKKKLTFKLFPPLSRSKREYK